MSHPLRDEPENRLQDPYEKRKNDGEPLFLPSLSTETLMEIFDFNDTDLHSNRAGFVTNAQRGDLRENLEGEHDALRLMLTIMLSVSILIGLILLSQGLPMLPLVIGAGLILGGLVFTGYLRQTDLKQDQKSTKVRHTQGFAQLTFNNSGTRHFSRLIVNGVPFELTLAQARALSEYELHGLRVYYMQNSKRLLSAEALRLTESDKLKNSDLIIDDDQQLIEQAKRRYEEHHS